MRLLQKLVLGAMLLATLANAGMIFFRDEVALFVLNAEAGCRPWSPAEIEYRPGITVCPGQSVVVRIPIRPAPRAGDGGA